MTGNMCGILDLKINVAEKATTRVPSGTFRGTCRSIDCHDIQGIVTQMTGNISLEAHISIFGRSHLLTIQIDITIEDESSKIEAHLAVFPNLFGLECLSIPAFAHRFETTRSTGTFIPWLFELEIMRQIDSPPIGIVECRTLGTRLCSQLELPIEIEQLVLIGSEIRNRDVVNRLTLSSIDILSRGSHRHDCHNNGKEVFLHRIS